MDDEFEVPSAHEHAVEHAAEKRVPLGQEIALFSAILATLGAVVSFLGGHTQNDALYYKNEAVLMKARASDDWAYYQAEQIKQHIEEIAGETQSGGAARNVAAAAHYAAHAKLLRAQAEGYDRQSDEADAESQRSFAPHIKLAIATTFIQIAIALASITALTKRRWLLWAAGGFAAVGIAMGVIAWF